MNFPKQLTSRRIIIRKIFKLGTVLAGYAIAFLLASAAEDIRILHTQGRPDYQASAGMYAFGEMLVFLDVFGVAALFPTGLALYFLRSVRKFWTALHFVVVCNAATGLIAVLAYVFARTHSPLYILAAFAVLRLLMAPVIALMLMVTAVMAPTKRSRWLIGTVAALEVLIGLYAFVTWFAGSASMY